MLNCLRRLVTALWAGSLWTTGYLVAPTLFATLADRIQAGTIAGNVFRTEAWVSLACGAILLLLLSASPVDESEHGIMRKVRTSRSKTAIIISMMMLCTAVSYFGLQPVMAGLRSGGLADEAARSQFGVLHAIASGIFLVQSLLAVWLVVRNK